jgi:class 3 adenylate cyclase
MAITFTLEDLARRAGEGLETLHAWQRLGLVAATAPFGPIELERVRLIQFLVRHGITPERIAAAHDGELATSFRLYLGSLFPSGDGEACSLADAARRAGLSLESTERFARTAGLSHGRDYFTADDAAMLGGLASGIAAGLPEEAVIQLVRVYRHTLARVAEAEIRLFHFYVHEALAASGLSGQALFDAADARSVTLLPTAEPALAYFHRIGFAHATREDMLLHLRDDAPASDTPGRLQAGIVFADLSSFTSLTEAMGDVRAADVVSRFGDLVHEATARWGGRVVKQVGDALLLVLFWPQAAVACALEVVARVAAEPSFPAARAGVHWGPVVYREGDYFGAGVNLAARLVTGAERRQVIVSTAARERAADMAGVEFVPLGARTLKGLVQPQELYEVRSLEHAPAARLRDPVCHMELAPTEVAARLQVGGVERVFCSEACLRRFVAAPEQYPAG